MAIEKKSEGYVSVIGAGDGTEVLYNKARSGTLTVTVDGDLGGASVNFGFRGKSGSFVEFPSDLTPLTTEGAAVIVCGSYHKLIVNVSGTTSTTNIAVIAGEVGAKS